MTSVHSVRFSFFFIVNLSMHILIVNNTSIPVQQYGGTERVIWWLGKELVKKGHQVSYLVGAGSYCDFATGVHELNHAIPFNQQIPSGVDVVHLNCKVNETPHLPYIFTLHGNTNDDAVYEKRKAWGITRVYKMVDTCSAEFEAKTPYFYSTFEN